MALLILSIGFDDVFADQKAPDFWISNLKDVRFKSKNQKRPIIISFFYIDCVPCRKEIPQLYKLIQSTYPETNLLFIDPIRSDSRKAILTYAKKLGIPRDYFYRDAIGTIARKYIVKNKFPTIVGIKNRQIVLRTNDLNASLNELHALLR